MMIVLIRSNGASRNRPAKSLAAFSELTAAKAGLFYSRLPYCCS